MDPLCFVNSEPPRLINDGNLLLLDVDSAAREINGEKFVLNRLCFANGSCDREFESNEQTLTVFIRADKKFSNYNVGCHYQLEISLEGTKIDDKFYPINTVTIFR